MLSESLRELVLLMGSNDPDASVREAAAALLEPDSSGISTAAQSAIKEFVRQLVVEVLLSIDG